MTGNGGSVQQHLPQHVSLSTSPRRQVEWDNCRSLFMFYVVVFHFFNNWTLEQATQEWSASWAHFFSSYTLWNERLAVPGFCCLSGMMSKGYADFPAVATSSGRQSRLLQRWRTSVSTLLVGSFNIQLLNYILYILLAKIMFRQESTEAESTIDAPFFPRSIFQYDHEETWYFMALFGWRLITPVFLRLMRYPFATSLVLAVFNSHVAFGPGDAHVRMRFFRYFPYFVAGLVLDTSVLDRIQRPILWGSMGVASTILLTICLEASTQRILFVVQYFDMDWSLQSLGVLTFQYIYSAALVLSTILLVRQCTVPLFPFGHANSTTAIYSWHWRVLDFVMWGQIPFSQSEHDWTPGAPVLDYFKSCTSSKSLFLDPLHHPLVAIVLLHVGSYCICVALGSKWAWQGFRYVNDPNCDWMFRTVAVTMPTLDSDQDTGSGVQHLHERTPTDSGSKQCV